MVVLEDERLDSMGVGVTTIACNSTRISGWTGKQTGVAHVTQITNFNSGKGPTTDGT